MKKWLAALFLITSIVTGCADRKTAKTEIMSTADSTEMADTTIAETDGLDELIAERPMPVMADELFDDFIFNFAANRKLQMERISFPLPVDSGDKKEMIEKKDWKFEHFFMRQDYYTLIFDSPEEVEQVKDTALLTATVEKIFLDDSFVRQYIFNRKGGRWMLTGICNQTLPRNPNASFLNFYQRFVCDSVFQHQSLSEQIDFVGPDPDNDFSQVEGVITPDFWDAFAPDLPKGMLYNIVYGHQDPAATQKVFVLRGIANGLEVELTFRLIHGHWKLTKMIT